MLFQSTSNDGQMLTREIREYPPICQDFQRFCFPHICTFVYTELARIVCCSALCFCYFYSFKTLIIKTIEKKKTIKVGEVKNSGNVKCLFLPSILIKSHLCSHLQCRTAVPTLYMIMSKCNRQTEGQREAVVGANCME